MESKQIFHGFAIDVPADTLAAALRQRACHHATLAGEYKQQIDRMKALNEERRTALRPSSPRITYRPPYHQRQHHIDRSDLLAFLADHLIEGTTYRLDYTALVYLGFPGTKEPITIISDID